MTKLAAKSKSPHAYPPSRPPSYPPRTHQGVHDDGGHEDDGQGPFMALMRTASGITRKELMFELGWSKTYIDGILNGEKNDPVEQARKFCLMLRKLKRTDLVAAVIVHIAGGDDFDGRVLTAVQVDALKELAKVVQS